MRNFFSKIRRIKREDSQNRQALMRYALSVTVLSLPDDAPDWIKQLRDEQRRQYSLPTDLYPSIEEFKTVGFIFKDENVHYIGYDYEKECEYDYFRHEVLIPPKWVAKFTGFFSMHKICDEECRIRCISTKTCALLLTNHYIQYKEWGLFGLQTIFIIEINTGKKIRAGTILPKTSREKEFGLIKHAVEKLYSSEK